jgi:hypothetical protein
MGYRKEVRRKKTRKEGINAYRRRERNSSFKQK